MAMKKKPTMKKKGMARGGAKMPMKTDPKTGKMVPAFAMDGKGKMNKGGMARKKKGYAMGGTVMKGNTLVKKMAMGGTAMKKKGMAKGGAMRARKK